MAAKQRRAMLGVARAADLEGGRACAEKPPHPIFRGKCKVDNIMTISQRASG